MPPNPKALISSRAGIFFALFLLTFGAHFVFCPFFGLYEDDYIYTIYHLDLSVSDALSGAIDSFRNAVQGRPLLFFFQRLLYLIGFSGGSLSGGYVVSALLITINGYLLLRLLQRHLSCQASWIGAVLYILHPADTSRQILMHQAAIHVGAMMLLVSLHAFSKRRLTVAYCIGALGLLNYESFYLPMIALPICLFVGEERIHRRIAIHLSLIAFTLGSVAGIRYFLGESRTVALVSSPYQALERIAESLLQGPTTAFKLLTLRPIDAIVHANALEWTIAACVAVAMVLVMSNQERASPNSVKGLLGFSAIAALGASCTYLFAFRDDTYPAIVAIGRLTAQHNPGLLCFAFLAAALWDVISIKKAPAWTIGFPAAIFGLLAAFSVKIQRTEYLANWTQQKQYWEKILDLCADARDGEVILVDIDSAANTAPSTPGFPRFANINYPPHAMKFFSTLPPGWKAHPVVYGFWTGASHEVLGDESIRVHTPPYFSPQAQPIISDRSFIFLKEVNGSLVRSADGIAFGSLVLHGRPMAQIDAAGALQASPLFKKLTDGNPEEWTTVRGARNYPR